jgi:hypothetical protein
MINKQHPLARTRGVRRQFLSGVSAAAMSMAMLQSGLSDYSSANILNYITGQLIVPALPAVWMALFTTAPTSDAGTGGTEVPTTNGYARQQVAGQLAAASAATTVITFGATPSYIFNGTICIAVGWSVRDVTTPANVPAGTTIVSATATTVTCNNTVSGVGTDTIRFSAFLPPTASTGNPEPATIPGQSVNAGITFAQATGAGWGTVTSFGLYDAVTAGNLLAWDYLGNFKWIPFTCTAANPGVMTTDIAADVPANSSSIVVTQKYGGTLPSGTWSGLLTTAGASGLTFNAGVNSTGTAGGGQFRQVTTQAIAGNVTASFAAGTLVISGA